MNDKINLWLHQVSTNYDNPEWLRKLADMLLPRCEHKDYDTGIECNNSGDPCFMPDYSGNDDGDICWVCTEHMETMGFCVRCGEFNAGIESFEFLHPGFCDNCWCEVEAENDRDEEYLYYDLEDKL